MNGEMVRQEVQHASLLNSGEKEYELAVNTQMHFNEILMKFRSFGITAIAAIYSYAATHAQTSGIATIFCVTLTSSQLMALVGIVMTIVFAALDLGYFLQLLLGAVDRSRELEKSIPYRLTSTISTRVPERCARSLIRFFYGVVLLAGVVFLIILPKST